MQTICGTDCCTQCVKQAECGGCIKTNGHPFGGTCVAAESVERGGMTTLKDLSPSAGGCYRGGSRTFCGGRVHLQRQAV